MIKLTTVTVATNGKKAEPPFPSTLPDHRRRWPGCKQTQYSSAVYIYEALEGNYIQKTTNYVLLDWNMMLTYR